MASISHDGGRKYRIMIGTEPDRKTIRFLGTQRDADRFKNRLERLASAQAQAEYPEPEVVEWLSRLPDKLHNRIAKAGLTKPRTVSAATLGVFLDQFFATLNIKQSTLHNYKMARKHLEKYFTSAKVLRDIDAADGDKFCAWLRDEQELAPATVSKWIIVCRMFFKRACKWKLIAENPLADVKAGSQTNRDRMFFVSREAADKVIDACPNLEWKLLFALSRYGGMRCPSEHLALTWADVDFEHDRIRISSSKTEHNEGGGERFIPMFPELRPLLLDAFAAAPDGAQHVITRYRDNRQNLRTQLLRIIRRAGLTPWEKPFHNLRSTRQTELSESYPIHVVCAWLGNSRAVAQGHYLQVTDAHFEKASHKAAQQARAGERTQVQGGQVNADFHSPATVCSGVQSEMRPRQGPNYPHIPIENPQPGASSVAQSGANDAGLQSVVDAWPVLSDDAKRRIIAIVSEKHSSQHCEKC